MYIDKEYGRKLSFFYKEVMEYLYKPDDGTLTSRLLSDNPNLDADYAKKTADKGVFIKRLNNLININVEEFIGTKIEIQPRINFDVTDCVVSAMNCKDKTFFIYFFADNVDEKIAMETSNEFNEIGLRSKIFFVFRNKMFGLTTGLDLFLNDYVSYLSKISNLENVLRINPSKLLFALGAGCSIDANIGSWQQLNDALSFELLASEDNYGLTNYGSKDINENVLNALANNFDKNSLIDIAIRKKKGEDDKTSKYFQYVHDILYMNYDESSLDYKTNTLVSISNCIKRINMKKIITYNFDSTLEKNINSNYRSNANEVKSSESIVSYGKGEVEIFHAHGYLPYDYDGITHVSDFILSDTDYYLNSSNDEGLPNSIQSDCFKYYDVIFIGCSFNDSNIKQILLSLEKNRKNRIYAIIKVPSFEELSKACKKKEVNISVLKYKMLLNNYLDYYGVKIIWIKDFDEIPTILDNINKSDTDIEINVDKLTENI